MTRRVFGGVLVGMVVAVVPSFAKAQDIEVSAAPYRLNPYFSAPTVTPGSLPSGGNALGSFGFTTAPVRQPPRDIQIGGRFTF